MSALAIGSAGLGDVFGPVPDGAAADVLGRAREAGLRYVDTAPLYGRGLAERRLGVHPALLDGLTVSTKVGRDVRDPGPGEPPFDFTAAGIRRSIESSLERLGRDRVDIVFLHDPDDHEREVYETGWPTLERMRDEGVVGAIGAGMNQSEMLARFVDRLDIDVVLLAGRYTLLDTSGADVLLPLCQDRGVAVVLGGVFNSGLLVEPREGALFDYRPAPSELLARAGALRAVANRHGCSLPQVALRFAAAHPAVTSIVVGVTSGEQVAENVAWFETDPPVDLWRELHESGLLPRGQFVLEP